MSERVSQVTFGQGPHQPGSILSPVEGVAVRALRLATDGPAVFSHNVADSYDDLASVTGIDRYSARVLGATLPGDVVHLPPELKRDYEVITSHYRAAGLVVAQEVAWGLDYGPNDHPGHTRSVFLFSDEAHSVHPDAKRLEAVGNYNDKNWFINMAKNEEYPIPPTDTYTRGEVPRQTFDGPWFVKGAVAASGTQVIRCENWQDVVAAARELGVNYQVQQGVNAIAFLNVQYNAHPNGKTEFVATTEQVLHGFAHDGNRYPSAHDPRRITDAAAAKAGEDGVVGMFAFDVAVLEKPTIPGDPDSAHVFIECNPRPNGSSYFTAVAERLGAPEWSGVNVETNNKSLGEAVALLDATGLAYDTERKAGAVIVNWGTAQDGKLGVLFVGSEEVQRAQQDEARRVLGKA